MFDILRAKIATLLTHGVIYYMTLSIMCLFLQEVVAMMNDYTNIPQKRLQHIAKHYISHARMQIMEGESDNIE